MHETYPLGLSLLDFVPNFGFLAGGLLLLRLGRANLNRVTQVLLIVGALLGFAGGMSMASWKLVYTLSGSDLQVLRDAQFPLVAPGFFLLFLGTLQILRAERPSSAAPLMAMAGWKVPFLIVMTVSALGLHGVLTFRAFQQQNRLAAALHIVSFLCILAMGGMASSEQTVAKQWIEESINVVGQWSFALGVWLQARQG